MFMYSVYADVIRFLTHRIIGFFMYLTGNKIFNSLLRVS